jgi:hypothetical protein
MSWKCWGHCDFGPCGCQRGIQLYRIIVSQCTMPCSLIWMPPWQLWLSRRHSRRKTCSSLWNSLHKSSWNITLKWLKRWVRLSFLQISAILSGSCDHVESCTREWISILKTRQPILPTTNGLFWRMWRTHSVPKYRHVTVTKLESLSSSNLIHPAVASKSCPSSLYSYDLSSNDEEYLMPTNVSEMSPGRTNVAANWFTAARLYWFCRLKHQRSGCRLIQISMITTLTQWRLQYMLDTGHNWLVAPTGSNALRGRRSLQCGTRHILYHTTWCCHWG